MQFFVNFSKKKKNCGNALEWSQRQLQLQHKQLRDNLNYHRIMVKQVMRAIKQIWKLAAVAVTSCCGDQLKIIIKTFSETANRKISYFNTNR